MKKISPNKYGVYSEEQAEKIAVENKNQYVEVLLLEIKNGWLYTYSVRTTCSKIGVGYFSGPLMQSRGVFHTRNDAAGKALQLLKDRRKISDQLLEHLEVKLQGSRQLQLI